MNFTVIDTLVTVAIATYLTHRSTIQGHARWVAATIGVCLGSVIGRAIIERM